MIDKAKAVIDAVKEKMQSAVTYLDEDLKTFRAGKANPAVFNSVVVNYYGTMTPIPQVASISTPDAKTMLIQPWDRNLIHPVEKAIMDANLGFTPQNNGEVIRINIPALTEERRKELVKKARTAGENAKVGVRNARRDAIESLKKLQKEGLPEDTEKDFELTDSIELPNRCVSLRDSEDIHSTQQARVATIPVATAVATTAAAASATRREVRLRAACWSAKGSIRT